MKKKIRKFLKKKKQGYSKAALFVIGAIKNKQLNTRTWQGTIPATFGNGASWARNGQTLDDIFDIERVKVKGEITHLKFKGLKTGNASTIKNYIPPKIRKNVLENSNGCVFCGDKKELEIDHKIGAKEYQDRADPILTDPDGYQVACKRCNCKKRQACEECQNSKKRPPAPSTFAVAFTHGGIDLTVQDDKKFISNEHNPCHGCPWSDRKKFMMDYEQIPNKRSLLKIVA